jgi:hypothetical protein
MNFGGMTPMTVCGNLLIDIERPMIVRSPVVAKLPHLVAEHHDSLRTGAVIGLGEVTAKRRRCPEQAEKRRRDRRA